MTKAEGRPRASEVKTGKDKGWIKTAKISTSKAIEAEDGYGADGEVIALARTGILFY